MDLKRVLEIEKRMAEIAEQTEQLKGEELDAAIKEVDELKAEKEELEKRAALTKQVERKSRAVITPADKDVFGLEDKELGIDSKEYRSAYLKRLQGVNLDEVEKRALTTSVSSVGYAVPTETLNKIIEKLKQESVVLPLVSVLSIPSNVSMPVEGTTNDADVVAEGTAATDKADTIGHISLTAYKIIKTLSITAEVKAMTIDAFEDFIVAQLVKKIKAKVDYLIINGTGSSQPTGILEALDDTVQEIETAANTGFTYTDLMTLLGTLKSGYARNGKLMAKRSFIYGTIASILDDNNRPIFKVETDGRFEGKLLGYPIVANDDMPDNKILFGDFEYYFWNFVQQPTIDVDTSVDFRAGNTCYRGMALADGNVALAEAFVLMSKKA